MSRALRSLLWARGLRDFGDGFVAGLLPVCLTALEFSSFEIGLLAGAALFGSAISFLGARNDHRLLLICAAGLMAATGVALSAFDSYALLLVVAFAGSVNPSASSFFVPVEHAVLTRESADVESSGMASTFEISQG